MKTSTEGIKLLGGGRTEVIRLDDAVIREAGTWSPTVHALLKHMEQQDFSGAPRVLGMGYDKQGREILSYLPGEIVHPRLYTEHAMFALGELILKMHAVNSLFVLSATARWQPWFCRDTGTPDIIGHADIAPWNIVTQNDLPVALIDWEFAGPIDRLTEIAYAAWTCAQLYDDDIADKNGLPDVRVRMQLVRTLSDSYELATASRHRLVDRLVEVAIRGAAAEVIAQNIQVDSPAAGNMWGIAWRTRSAAWMLRNKSTIHHFLK